MEAYWGLLGFVIFYVLFEALLISRIDSNSSSFTKSLPIVVGLAYSLVGAALLYRVLVHARVVAHEGGLSISNPFRGDQNLAWNEIASMTPERLLIIRCHDGRRVIAWVIQKNGWSRMRQIRQESDEAIDELGALATRALGTPTSFTRS
jgi:xanthine/uracil permease